MQYGKEAVLRNTEGSLAEGLAHESYLHALACGTEDKKEGIAAIISLPIEFMNEVIGVLRLYHYASWDISDQDLDSLGILANNIGLAMTYTRFRNAVFSIAEIIGNTFHVELSASIGKSLTSSRSS